MENPKDGRVHLRRNNRIRVEQTFPTRLYIDWSFSALLSVTYEIYTVDSQM